MARLNSFADLGVLPRFSALLGERNICRPTDIQVRVIPELLEGRSVVFRSATGTGKTFAYLIPLFQRFFSGDISAAEAAGSPQNGGGPRPAANKAGGVSAAGGPVAGVSAAGGPVVLILAPTYELCSQIRGEAEFLLRDKGGLSGAGPGGGLPSVGLLIGSGNLKRQIDGLKKDRPAVVVGNPGRILLLARMGKLKFGALRSLVFDEGDRLVAEDLRAETMELLGHIAGPAKTRENRAPGPGGTGPLGPRRPPGGRADLLCAACSATLSAKSWELLLPFMGGEPRVIETDEQEILRERIQHWALWSEGRQKIRTLRSFLAAVKPRKALVFCGRSWDAENVVSQLRHLSAAALYGGMGKNRHRGTVDSFRSGTLTVLVCSDLAARGLDIPEISHVIALDVPQDAEAYTHRAGRTGRAGKRGIMVSIGDEAEMRRLALLEKRLGLTVYPKELYRGQVVAPATE